MRADAMFLLFFFTDASVSSHFLITNYTDNTVAEFIGNIALSVTEIFYYADFGHEN